MISLPIKKNVGVLRKTDDGEFVVDFTKYNKSIKVSNSLLEILRNRTEELLGEEEIWLWRCVDYFDDTDNQFRVVGHLNKEL